MKIFCFGMVMAAHAAIAGGMAYNVGRNLLANSDFAMNNGVDADGWEHVVQFGTNAVMRIVKVEGQPGIRQAAEMFFTARDRAVQTRYKQTVPFETNTVYELEYSYQSGMDGALHADVMMTGSDPLYRSFSNIPSAKWTRVRRLFATPEVIQIVEGSIFLFQNRSMVPIRYANGSLRATDIKPEDIRYEFFMPIVLGARGVFYWENSTIKWRHKYRDELKRSIFENARELSALSSLILSEESLPEDAPNVSVTAPDSSVYVMNHIFGGKGIIIIGRDRTAIGDAAYKIAPGGFAIDGSAFAPIAPGEIVIIRYGKK